MVKGWVCRSVKLSGGCGETIATKTGCSGAGKSADNTIVINNTNAVVSFIANV